MNKHDISTSRRRFQNDNQYSKNCSEVLFGFFHQDIWFLEIEFHVDAAFEKGVLHLTYDR